MDFVLNNTLNLIGGKGDELYSYGSGPGSVLGLGRTFIGRYTDTTLAGGKIKSYGGSDTVFDLNMRSYPNFAG